MVNKIPIIVLLFITAVDVAVAQDTIASQMELIFAVESLPSFGNDRKYSKLIDFVESNLTYEDTLSRTKTVYVCFAVDTLGFTRNHSVLRSDDSLLNEEALRVCRLIKFDRPAMQRGKPIQLNQYLVPVRFSSVSENESNVSETKRERCWDNLKKRLKCYKHQSNEAVRE